MSIDDRDYMRDRNGASDMEARRFRTSEQQKAHQAEELKDRFARYSGSSRGLAAPKARRSRFFLIALVLVVGAVFWTRWPDIPARLLTRFASTPDDYRAGNRIMGHRIDLGGRINGNFKIRRFNPDLIAGCAGRTWARGLFHAKT